MTGHAIHIKLDGRTYCGSYKVERQILTVTMQSSLSAARLALVASGQRLADEEPRRYATFKSARAVPSIRSRQASGSSQRRGIALAP